MARLGVSIRTGGTVLALLALMPLGGCLVSAVAPPRVEVANTEPVLPVPMPVSGPETGAIFQSSQYRPLFEDHRARLVGDTLTVTIVEKVTATQSSRSTVDKTGTLTGAVTALPGISPNAFRRATADATSANTFEGKGATENSNDFSGTITVLVTGVLPNGHLLVAGEKQIGVNQNVDVLRFSGQVDPRAIGAANTVQSTAVANVRVEHRGRGAAANANAVGWLARFFLSVMPI
jgi:flagellar L-ring protein precursor FlgH